MRLRIYPASGSTRRFLANLILTTIGLLPLSASAQFDQSGGGDIVEVRTFVSFDTVVASDTVWLAARLDLAPSYHINSATPKQDFLIPTRLDLEFPSSVTAGEIRYPEGEVIPLQNDKMSVYETGTLIFIPVVVSKTAISGTVELVGSLYYQACDDNVCLAPTTANARWTVNVADQRGAPRYPKIFALVDGSPEPGSTLDASVTSLQQDSELERLIRDHGTWGYVLALLLAFGTGFLLSFSPCTYPMIPITVSIFAGQARGPGRGFVLSLFYVLTMAVIYGIMGVVVASVGGVFGAWLAHPIVVGLIVAIFIIFALSMFGLYDLQVPEGLRNKMAGRGGKGVGGAIVLGAVAALVISPCVGPFVAGILLYVATAGSAFLGFLILFTFALGLGTLFVVIGTFSSSINALPNAGVWMESVKKFFGFILLLMALYFARTLLSTDFTALLAGLLFLGAGVFGGGFDRLTPEATFFPRLKKAFGILCVILGVYFFGGYLLHSGLWWPPVDLAGSIVDHGNSVEQERIRWQSELESGIERGRQEGKPILIDTWATWCANCRKLDRSTWVDDQVVAEVERFVPIKLQLETQDSPETIHFMDYFNLPLYSLPTIIIIDSQGQIDIIQGYVGPEDMAKRLRSVV